MSSCCCPHAVSAGKFFSFFARRLRKRFVKKGLEESQQQLVAGLRQAGFRDATLLEIGSGVGGLHQTLLEEGAASAVGIDLASKMLKEAREMAEERGLSARTKYIEDDFMNLADRVDKADITILDKVICCYPDADGLVHQSLAKTRRVYALTYPRDRLLTRIGEKLVAVMMWLFRSAFRSYVHDPRQIEAWITAEGFKKRYQNQTTIWLTQIYVRES